jgi:transcriptional regulator with XRE-family HTH domain
VSGQPPTEEAAAPPRLSREESRLLGRQIAGRRKDLRLTQEQLARAVGMSRNQIQNYEAGFSFRKDRTPINLEMSTLFVLCRELHVAARLDVSPAGEFRIVLEPTSMHGAKPPAEL